MTKLRVLKTVIMSAAILVAHPAFADYVGAPAKTTFGKAEYSPYLDRGYPDRVYFGDPPAYFVFHGRGDARLPPGAGGGVSVCAR